MIKSFTYLQFSRDTEQGHTANVGALKRDEIVDQNIPTEKGKETK